MQRIKSKANAITSDAYLRNATDLLEDLSDLLRLLGISAKFKINGVSKSDVTTRTRGHKIALAFTIGEILTIWHSDRHFRDLNGLPLPLQITGRGPSFQKLVAQVRIRAPIDEVLETLSRLGAIKICADGRVTPERRTLPVFADPDFAVHHTFIALQSITRVLRHNLNSKPTNKNQRFHRIAWNGQLSNQDVSMLRLWLNRHGQALLESADEWMKLRTRSMRKKVSSARKSNRVSIGIYMDVNAPRRRSR